jgi:hypothetical protein
MDNFVRRLKKGTDKYKVKLPLFFFNCYGVGHFSHKFTYKKNKINEEEYDSKKKIQKGRRNKNNFFMKNIFTKEDSSSLDEDEVSNSDIERVLFMEIEDSDEEGYKEEYEEAKFDYIEKLLSSIEVIKIEIKKNKSLQEEPT